MTTDDPRAEAGFADWLWNEGPEAEVQARAVKRTLARQIVEAMEAQRITKLEMARRMGTSRTHLDRLLDPANDRVQLDTIQRAAAAIGRRLRVELA